jgi:hypothetical protein
MGLEQAIARRLHLDRCGRKDGYAAEQHLWVLAEMILHEIDRLEGLTEANVKQLPEVKRSRARP